MGCDKAFSGMAAFMYLRNIQLGLAAGPRMSSGKINVVITEYLFFCPSM
jgi:hypothetical protein